MMYFLFRPNLFSIKLICGLPNERLPVSFDRARGRFRFFYECNYGGLEYNV